ncbi:MBL fold metallo-hydrolase [Mumia sp. Pv 4-285]|uniref:MBL fold metallo-hydrolase n=1 Tax=Mumia qirimensis TaxID=3234852 RepID=UPI00351CF6CE
MAVSSTSPDVTITYLGGPTTVIDVASVRFITDPTFDSPGRDYPLGPVVTLSKTRGPAIEVTDLGDIDVALVSHQQHPDNLDDSGRELLGRIGLVLTAPASAEKLPAAVALSPGAVQEIPTAQGITLRVTATPARHGPRGAEAFAGDVIGFVIDVVETGEALVYVTGDTVWFDGVGGVAKSFQPRVVILHGGAARTDRSAFRLTMDANDAAEVRAAFPEAVILPVHHDGWTHLIQSQQDLANAFAVLGLDGLQLVEPGGTYTFAGGVTPAARRLDALVGEWTMHPSLGGEPAGLGRTTFAWSTEGSFLVQRAESEPSDIEISAEWTASSPFPTCAVIGVDEVSGEFSMLYADARGVRRVYRMTIADGVWTVWRETPSLHQRYTGRFSDDGTTIVGGWETSHDGSSWTPDFDLDYRKVG